MGREITEVLVEKPPIGKEADKISVVEPPVGKTSTLNAGSMRVLGQDTFVFRWAQEANWAEQRRFGTPNSQLGLQRTQVPFVPLSLAGSNPVGSEGHLARNRLSPP